MWVEKKNKAFAYRVPIGDYNYLQCNDSIGRGTTVITFTKITDMCKVSNMYLLGI